MHVKFSATHGESASEPISVNAAAAYLAAAEAATTSMPPSATYFSVRA